jgi:hypothetical protein
LTAIPSLQEMVQREIARRAEADKRIAIRRLSVKPIYDGNDRRIGSMVWDDGVELDEHDPRFRAAVCGRLSIGRGEVTKVDDEDTHGISGGAAIFRRVVPTSPTPSLKGDRGDAVADDDAVDCAARIAALRSRESS